MTNATLLLQSLSLSTSTAQHVIDRNDGSGVSWADSALTFTTAAPVYESDAEQAEISFPVTAADLEELHRILTAHLAQAEYSNELTTEHGYAIVHASGSGVRVEAGTENGNGEVVLSDLAVRAWHTQLTLTLLAAAL